MNIPAELKYTSSHEWLRIENDEVVIGITDHAQSELGDIVFVELPEVGRALQQEESFGTVESVKTVSDLYAPIAGEVTAVNETLVSRSEVVNSDPYGDGWMIRIRMNDPSQLEGLLTAEGYGAQIEEQ